MPVSPNMSLQIPTVGQTAAPDYGLNINASLSIIDAHDHTPGNGVPITTDGINITSSLTLNQNDLIDVRSVKFYPQPSPIALVGDVGCLSVAGVDLYYNDVDGNIIRLTQNGDIAGSPGSISGLTPPASASYNSGLSSFIWESEVNTPAIMDGGPITIRKLSLNSAGITLAPASGLSSSYNLTLPAVLPSTTQALLLTDNSGNQSYLNKGTAYTIPQMDSAGTNLGYGVVQRISQEAVGQQVSSSSGAFTTTSATLVDVTNLSVVINTSGRPVIIMCIGDGSGGNVSQFRSITPSTTNVVIAVKRDTTVLSTSQGGDSCPPSAIQYIDQPAIGSYTYKIQIVSVGGAPVHADFMQLVAYEL